MAGKDVEERKKKESTESLDSEQLHGKQEKISEDITLKQSSDDEVEMSNKSLENKNQSDNQALIEESQTSEESITKPVSSKEQAAVDSENLQKTPKTPKDETVESSHPDPQQPTKKISSAKENERNKVASTDDKEPKVAAAREGKLPSDTLATDDEKAQKIAAAKAKAAEMAKARAAKKAAAAVPEEPVEPSHNQPILDRYMKEIEEQLGKDKLEDSYINRLSKHVPTLVAKPESYFEIAEFLKINQQLRFEYVSELHGTDFVSHIEVYVYLYSFTNKQSVVLKVKLDRNQPVIPSLVPLWEGANWPECEAYDLLGIHFENHPDLKRILLGEEWIGYPLRKDYEPHDVEV